MGLDHCGFSPRVQQKIAHAGVNSASYQQGSRDLAELSDLSIAPKAVERMARKIGLERNDQRDAAVKLHRRLPLMAKDAVASPQCSCPQVAMVSIDGGRLQIRSKPSEPRQETHWRESSEAAPPTNCRVTAKFWTEGSGVSKTEGLPLFMKPLSGWWSFGPDTRSLS